MKLFKIKNTLVSALITGGMFAISANATTYNWNNGDYTNINGTSITGNPGVSGNGSSLGTFNNNGSISSTGDDGFELSANATSIVNRGTITSSASSFFSGLYLNNSGFLLSNLNNSGTISGTASNQYGIFKHHQKYENLTCNRGQGSICYL